MTRYNSQVCYGENKFKIQYETDNVDNYKHIELEIRKQIDKENKIMDYKVMISQPMNGKTEKQISGVE